MNAPERHETPRPTEEEVLNRIDYFRDAMWAAEAKLEDARADARENGIPDSLVLEDRRVHVLWTKWQAARARYQEVLKAAAEASR